MQGSFTLNPFIDRLLGYPDKSGTVVWEVDHSGNRVGPEYYSLGWTNRNAPPSRPNETSPQWIEEMVIGTSRAAARIGVDDNHIGENLPLKTIRGDIASSSPYNRDVLLKLVDSQGNEVTRFTRTFLTVVTVSPDAAHPGDCIAEKILVSDSKILQKPNYKIGDDGQPVIFDE